MRYLKSRAAAMLFVVSVLATPYTLAGEPVRLVTWNVESGGSHPPTIAQELAQLDLYDVYVLTEVLPAGAKIYRSSIAKRSEQPYESVLSETGGGDRLQIVYNAKRFEKTAQTELHQFREYPLNDPKRRHRSPLVVTLKDRNSRLEFKVVAVHFAFGDKDLRRAQAKGLRLWADEQSLPLIAMGCFNFMYRFPDKGGNDAFREFMLDYIWRWPEPERLIDTNWSDRDEDGEDDFQKSVLDFAYVANQAKIWEAKSRIVKRDTVLTCNRACRRI